jgi:hypothetical protein
VSHRAGARALCFLECAVGGWRRADLGLSDLVAPLVYGHLLQQRRDDLSAGLGVLGQQYLKLLREVLEAQERRTNVSIFGSHKSTACQ